MGRSHCLPKKNVDFGGGLERIAMAVANIPDIIDVCHSRFSMSWKKLPAKNTKPSPDARSVQHRRRSLEGRIVFDWGRRSAVKYGAWIFCAPTSSARHPLCRSSLASENIGLSALIEPAIGSYREQYPETFAARESIERGSR